MIEEVFQLPPSALALSSKTFSALNRRFDGLIPRWKPYPSLPPDGLDPVGALALLGFWTSQALSPSVRSQGRLSPEISLSVLVPLVPRGTGPPNSQGFPNQRPGILLYRTPACLAFLPRFKTHCLFENVTRRGLFFPLEGPQSLSIPKHLLFATDPFSPFGRP